MASSASFTSPLCTWLVAACMSFSCGRDPPQQSSMLGPSSKRLSRRRKLVSSKCHAVAGGGSSLVSSFYGSSIQGLMSSCLAFEPCNEFYSSTASSIPSLGFFSDNALASFFGSKNVSFHRNQRRLRRLASHSGLFLIFVFLSVGSYFSFLVFRF